MDAGADALEVMCQRRSQPASRRASTALFSRAQVVNEGLLHTYIRASSRPEVIRPARFRRLRVDSVEEVGL